MMLASVTSSAILLAVPVLMFVLLLWLAGSRSRRDDFPGLFDPGTFLDADPVVCIVDVRECSQKKRWIVESYGLDLAPAALIVSGIPDNALVKFVNTIMREGVAEVRQSERNIILQFAVRRELKWLESQLVDSFDLTMPLVRPGVP